MVYCFPAASTKINKSCLVNHTLSVSDHVATPSRHLVKQHAEVFSVVFKYQSNPGKDFATIMQQVSSIQGPIESMVMVYLPTFIP